MSEAKKRPASLQKTLDNNTIMIKENKAINKEDLKANLYDLFSFIVWQTYNPHPLWF